VKSVRVFVCTGGSASDIVIDGIDWVTANHVQPAVINLSLGGDPNLAIDDAVNDAIDAGIPCAVAAGNDHVDASTKSPSRVARAVTVGATEIMTDTIASFSNFGPSVDVFAPGVDIYSLWYGNDNYIISASGTSQATPQVAGLLALYRQCNPNLTPAQLSALVIADSTKNVVVFTEGTTSPNRLIYTGYAILISNN
jgi:subtilisin family serine protease